MEILVQVVNLSNVLVLREVRSGARNSRGVQTVGVEGGEEGGGRVKYSLMSSERVSPIGKAIKKYQTTHSKSMFNHGGRCSVAQRTAPDRSSPAHSTRSVRRSRVCICHTHVQLARLRCAGTHNVFPGLICTLRRRWLKPPSFPQICLSQHTPVPRQSSLTAVAWRESQACLL